MLADRCERLFRRIDETVGRLPGLEPTAPAETERAREVIVGREEVVRFADARVLVLARLLEDGLEEREIVFGLVDRVFAVRRGGPPDASVDLLRRGLCEVVEVA